MINKISLIRIFLNRTSSHVDFIVSLSFKQELLVEFHRSDFKTDWLVRLRSK